MKIENDTTYEIVKKCLSSVNVYKYKILRRQECFKLHKIIMLQAALNHNALSCIIL